MKAHLITSGTILATIILVASFVYSPDIKLILLCIFGTIAIITICLSIYGIVYNLVKAFIDED